MNRTRKDRRVSTMSETKMIRTEDYFQNDFVLDKEAFERLAIPVGLFQATSTYLIIVLIPKQNYKTLSFDHMVFDREMCAIGIKEFIRPTTFSDYGLDGASHIDPDMHIKEEYVLVRQVSPDVRDRYGVTLTTSVSDLINS